MTEPIERHEMLEVEQAWTETFGENAGRPPDAAERINFLRGVVIAHRQEADEASSRAGPEGGHLERARDLVNEARGVANEGALETATLMLHSAHVHAAIALAERV